MNRAGGHLRLKDVRGRYHQWMDTLPGQVRQRQRIWKEKSWDILATAPGVLFWALS